MKRLTAAFGLLLALSACAAEQAPPPAHVAQTLPPKIQMDVQAINLADRSGLQPSSSPYASNRFSPTIAEAIKQWASDRLQATGQSGQAIVVIKDASLVAQPIQMHDGIDSWFTRQQAMKYIGRAEVSIEANGRPGFALADAVATRAITLPENPTAVEKQDAYYTLLNGLMKDLGQNLETGIQTHMSGFLVTAQSYGVTAVPTGSSFASANDADAPVIIQSPSPPQMSAPQGGMMPGQPASMQGMQSNSMPAGQPLSDAQMNPMQISAVQMGNGQMGMQQPQAMPPQNYNGQNYGAQNYAPQNYAPQNYAPQTYGMQQGNGMMQPGMNSAVADATLATPQQVAVSPPTMTISQSGAAPMQQNGGIQNNGMMQPAYASPAPLYTAAAPTSAVTQVALPPPAPQMQQPPPQTLGVSAVPTVPDLASSPSSFAAAPQQQMDYVSQNGSGYYAPPQPPPIVNLSAAQQQQPPAPPLTTYATSPPPQANYAAPLPQPTNYGTYNNYAANMQPPRGAPAVIPLSGPGYGGGYGYAQ